MMTAYSTLQPGCYLPKGIRLGVISTQGYDSLHYQAYYIASALLERGLPPHCGPANNPVHQAAAFK